MDIKNIQEELGAFFKYLSTQNRTSSVLSKMEQHFKDASAKGNLRLLNAVHKEMRQRIRDTFSKTDKAQFEQYLRDNVLHQVELDKSNTLQSILERGWIENEDEYRVLYGHVENLIRNSGLAAEITKSNELLAAYEKAQNNC